MKKQAQKTRTAGQIMGALKRARNVNVLEKQNSRGGERHLDLQPAWARATEPEKKAAPKVRESKTQEQLPLHLLIDGIRILAKDKGYKGWLGRTREMSDLAIGNRIRWCVGVRGAVKKLQRDLTNGTPAKPTATLEDMMTVVTHRFPQVPKVRALEAVRYCESIDGAVERVAQKVVPYL